MPVCQLPRGVVKLISSTQVINSVSSVIKELVENSIDSGASVIDIKLEKYGLDKIEVRDNGSGISSEDVYNVCLPNYTSKINSFADLESLSSYGFRGEALNSLCAVSQLSITTRTEADEVASSYIFDSNGTVREVQPSHQMKGTVVTVTKLFENVPVRKQIYENTRKAAEELTNIEKITKTLSLIHPKLRVTFAHNKCLIWCKTCVSTLKQSLMQIYPHMGLKNLEYFSHCVGDLTVEMLICKRDCNWSALVQPFQEAILFFVNRRPVKDKKVEKLVLEEMTYLFQSSLPNGKCPLTLISLQLPPQELDVNLEPDKTKVFMKNHEEVLKQIRESIMLHFYKGTIRELNPVPIDDNNGKSESKKRKRNDSSSNDIPSLGNCTDSVESCFPSSLRTRFEIDCANQDSSKIDIYQNVDSCVPDFDDFPEILINEHLDRIIGVESNVVQSSNSIKNEFREKLENQNENFNKSLKCISSESTSEVLMEKFDGQSSTKTLTECSFSDDLELPVSRTVVDSKTLSQTTLSQWSKGNLNSDGRLVEGPKMLVDEKNDGSSDNWKNDSKKKLPSSAGSQTGLLEHRVSSRLGKKDLAGLTNFARKIRSEIITENPGISFKKVASELANRWRNLEEGKRNEYAVKVKESESIKVKTAPIIKPCLLETKRTVFLETNVENIKTRLNSWKQCGGDDSIRVINYLRTQNECLCRIENSVNLVNLTHLQENVIYHRYLCHSSIPLKPLDKPVKVTSIQIGNHLWSFLLSLEKSECSIIDPRVCKNGFNIVVKESSEEVLIMDIAKESELDIIKNLIEILQLAIVHNDLQFCRSETIKQILMQKVMETLENKRTLDTSEIEMLLHYWLQRMAKKTCIPYDVPVTMKMCKL